MSYRELLLGCGYKRDKRLFVRGFETTWHDLMTIDSNDRCKPDIVRDLNDTNLWEILEINARAFGLFNEVHAYEVLEHLGSQGDFASFFKIFTHIWNVLAPNGYLCATTPSRFSPWLWGDPGHRRAILPESLIFLDQTQYQQQCGVTPMSDYRFCYTADFKIIESKDDKTTHSFILRAIKPSRYQENKT